jgi:hypothetical protein
MTLPFFKSSSAPASWPAPDARHWLYAGGSGYGKSYAMLVDCQASLQDRDRGVHVIDIEDELTPKLIDYLAQHTPWRRVHLLDPNSRTHAFTLPLLRVADPRDLQACNDVARRALAVLGQVANFGADEYGPRTTKLLFLALFALARSARPLAALPELLASSPTARTLLAHELPYQFQQDALLSLNQLPARARIDYTDAPVSRLIAILSSPVNRRLFGSTHTVDLARVVANREVVLLPLGSLEHVDAVLIGSAYYSILHHAALHEPLDSAAPTDIYIDEVANFLTPDLSRGFDRLRKRKKFLRVACQRFSQFQKPDDPAGNVLSAVLTNCRRKTLFGGLPPPDAELLARMFFTGHLDLDTVWKEASRRPVVTGQRKVTLASHANAEHRNEQEAKTTSDSYSKSSMRALADTSTNAWGLNDSNGTGLGYAALPDGGIITPPTPLSQSLTTNSGRSRSFSGSASRGRVAAQQAARAHAEALTRATARGRSHVTGSSEAFMSEFSLLETESFSLEEKVHALVGAVINLQPRDVLIKVDGNPPYCIRTPDLIEPFKTAPHRDTVLALFQQKLARSPYLRSLELVDAEIAAAIADLVNQPDPVEPDFAAPIPNAPENVPDERGDAEGYAERWWQRHPNASDVLQPSGGLRVIKGGRNVENSDD